MRRPAQVAGMEISTGEGRNIWEIKIKILLRDREDFPRWHGCADSTGCLVLFSLSADVSAFGELFAMPSRIIRYP